MINFENIKKGFFGLVSLILFIYAIFYLKSCTDNFIHKHKKQSQDSTQTVKIVIKRVYQDRWKTIEGKTIRIVDSIPILQNLPIDTLAVIKNYYRENSYCDTLRDSSLLAVIKIKVAENKLKQPPTLDYKILVPQIEKTITVTNTITRKDTINMAKVFLLVGIRAGVNEKLIGAIAPEMILVLKNKRAVGVSYDVIQKTYNVSAYFPIKF